ncbi:hypothetical protein GCM10025857_39720 [Alicyclobacillus contaminans]|uniref:tail completion protein gp17 n=1 Tax=Alicyclobacillus contaminans TaxID=392016 RepID=UPI00047EB116|nr:DUF3168 domain-containing protein [Alicyclobacillus contaminans]GMA48662.1 hypothetical protein GCM10025857_00190 [Alicyclobacillus contaminans]GMA52615.1 hypothetical protein GCM10025857_39720 [Alicyclobacillus contaminans]
MINLKESIKSALIGDSELVNLLGGERVYQIRAPNATEFPRITFFELTSFNSDYADDVPIASQFEFQIDIWTKGSFSAIAAAVDRVMQSIGFRLIGTAELYEDDVQVYHKALRYRTKAEG